MITIFAEKQLRRTFFGLSSFQILAMFRRGLFYSYLSIYLRAFLGLSVTETTLFATLPMIMNVVFQMFIWGILSDKLQLRRTFIILGEIVAGFSTLLVFFGHRMVEDLHTAGWIIIIGLSIVEIFWSMSNVGPDTTRQKVHGQLSSVGGIGRIIGVLIGGMLYDGLKLQYMGWGFYEGSLFYIAAIAMFLSTIPMFFMPEGGVKEEQSTKVLREETNDISPNGGSKSTLVFIVSLIAMIFINFGRNSLAVIFSPYMILESGFNIDSEALSFLINFQSVGIILTGLIVGIIGKKIGSGYSTLFGTSIAIIAILMITFSSFLPIIYIANFIRGMSEVIVTASAYAFISDLIPAKQRARGFSIYNATFFLSWGMSGTFLTGPIIDFQLANGVAEVLAYKHAFLAAVVVTTVGFLLFFALLRKLNKSS
ncbi:MAG: MFS transporter [Promethearchaeota archaeon]